MNEKEARRLVEEANAAQEAYIARKDREMAAESEAQGMYPKYQVLRRSPSPYDQWQEVEDAFVLVPAKDYHARVAMAAYIESVRGFDPQLANDLEEFLAFTMPAGGVQSLKMRPD